MNHGSCQNKSKIFITATLEKTILTHSKPVQVKQELGKEIVVEESNRDLATIPLEDLEVIIKDEETFEPEAHLNYMDR